MEAAAAFAAVCADEATCAAFRAARVAAVAASPAACLAAVSNTQAKPTATRFQEEEEEEDDGPGGMIFCVEEAGFMVLRVLVAFRLVSPVRGRPRRD
jgi:hypothetical protein